MSELLKQEEQTEEQQSVQINEDTAPAECVAENSTGVVPEAKPKKKFELTKKSIVIISVALVLVITVLFTVFHKSEFEKTRDGVLKITGMVEGKGDYFTIDTYPDEYKNLDSTLRSILLPQAQENALEAIKYANEELNFNGSLYSKMMSTTSLMGRQTDENDKYKVSWTYHPNEGLEVTYEKK